ncbi:hypothetical protein [Mangrovibrevibacter kandeliae]|uniref:hypothetical protein n=1 Tax=Mangrovibrevibacter kandeliae TaxID=2968473 RepID=UPI0021197F46|nr:hypothetical protein [Aurantimonas sp. CSK15Z-1]MCQ8783235.1 hypothetical protein [Aurantimonas sp. CSK15Z-1]
MSAIEASIRRTLEAGDASDPAFRERVYIASRNALERLIQRESLSHEDAMAQLQRLADALVSIETDYAERAAASNAAAPPDERAADEIEPQEAEAWPQEDWDPDAPAAGGLDYDGADDVPSSADDPDGLEPHGYVSDWEQAGWGHTGWSETEWHGRSDGTTPAPEPEPQDETAAAPEWIEPPPQPPVVRRSLTRRIPVAVWMVVGLLAVVLAGGVIWSLVLGRPLLPTEAELAGTGQGDWIELFGGGDLQAVTTADGARAEAVTRRDVAALGIASAEDGGGEVAIAIGPGLLPRLAGRRMSVEIEAGSPDGAERVFGVRCLVAGESVCGRQRFATAQANETFLFETDLPERLDAASLGIDPGLGTPKTLDLYRVRVRPVP